MQSKTSVKEPTKHEPATHIALFVPSLRGGGAERVMVTLANAFAERGVKVDLVLAKAEGAYRDQVSELVRVIDLDCRRVALSLPRLVRYLRREQPQAMLSAMSHANVIAIFARWLARSSMRLVVSAHTTPSQSKPRYARGRLVPMLTRKTYPFADAIVAVSQGVADDLVQTIHLDPCKIEVIYNPVVDDSIPAKAAEPLNHPWFADGSPPVILGVGRLTEAKDFQTLIRAFALVRAKRVARLMILGEGEQREELEALVDDLGLREDVEMPGFVSNPFAYMRRAAVFVLSSRWEGFGNVLVEAMACGTPVVSTDCPNGPREILNGGKLGWLVSIGEPKELAAAIVEALNTSQTWEIDAKCLKTFDLMTAVEMYLAQMGITQHA